MKRIGIIFSILLWPAVLWAQLELASPFTDHMVLQRDQPVPVWGTANPNAKVTVSFDGQKKVATANAEGQWMLQLDPLKASFESRSLSVKAADQQLTLMDVLVGEVWICSGQSNMQYAYGSVPEIKALAPDAKNLRTFEVKRMVAFTEQDRCEGRWEVGIPGSAVAFSFAYFLEQAAEVPVGIILTCWGSSGIEAWMPRDMTKDFPYFKTLMDEFDANTDAHDQIKAALARPEGWSRQEDVFLRRQNNILYNAMMKPLAPYACRGLVWYQGERNTQSMYGMIEKPWFSRNSGMLLYGDVLQGWIQRYRQEWQNEQLHFLVVMLPGYGGVLPTSPLKDGGHPASHSWAWMRESQLKALNLPHTAVANTIDLGDVKNVHPKDKLPVGQRLALLARRDTLGQDVVAEGPVLDRVEAKAGGLVVHFKQANGLKTLDGEAPREFWLSDDSEKWHAADARLEGETVLLRSADCPQPLYVRYAFTGKPSVNLVNAAGLPAYPFRTDSFAP